MRGWKRWFDTWGMFLSCAVFIGISLVVIPHSLAASRNDGTFGTFTAETKSCFRSCTWMGEFDSDDGHIHLDDAQFDSGELKHPGDQARAQLVQGAGDQSLYRPNSRAWVILSLGAIGCLVYMAWWIKARRWRGPRRKHEDDDRPPAATPAAEARLRLRDVAWFETLEDRDDWTSADTGLLRAWPYLYLSSVVVFLAGLVLAVLALINEQPVLPGAALCILGAFTPLVMVAVACGDQGRPQRSFYGLRALLWLHLGAGARQAFRAIAVNRRVRLQGTTTVPPGAR